MNSSSIDIKDILESESSLGLNLGVDLFIGKEPEDPRECVTIYDTSGYPPQLPLSGTGLEYPSIQIRVRNKSYVNGWDMAEAIKSLLHGQGDVTIDGTLYSAIYCLNGPAFTHWDENDLCHFVINFNIVRR